jgi:hypothetical protein
MKLIAVARITVAPPELVASTTVLTMPRSGLLSDRRDSTTVARSDRVRPAELVQAGAAQARLRGQVVLHEQAHHEGRGMPSAGDQPAVRARRRGRRIDVERLRIEFLGESNDASLIDADAAAPVRAPERVVVEIAQPVIVHPGSIAAPVTCELIDHRCVTEILQFTCEPRTVAAMLPQTAQTTETDEKPHRSHAVIRKARRKSPSPRDKYAGAEPTWGVLWIQRTCTAARARSGERVGTLPRRR